VAHEVTLTTMRQLAWQCRRRFGRDHELTLACQRAEVSMAPDEIDLLIELLAELPGISGRHLRAAFNGW
jgi:hypothetical protein